MKKLLMRMAVISAALLCLLTIAAYAQDADEIQLFNRNERVPLSKSILQEKDDYYISVDDLEKINIRHKFTENDNGFEFVLYSENTFGTENTLLISADYQELCNLNGACERTCYFTSSMKSMKELRPNGGGMQVVERKLENDQPILITEDGYYISLNALAVAISYEYLVKDHVIKLWITDARHHVINGEVRFFVWDSHLKPLSLSAFKKVNEPYYPEDMEFYDVNPASRYLNRSNAMLCLQGA